MSLLSNMEAAPPYAMLTQAGARLADIRQQPAAWYGILLLGSASQKIRRAFKARI